MNENFDNLSNNSNDHKDAIDDNLIVYNLLKIQSQKLYEIIRLLESCHKNKNLIPGYIALENKWVEKEILLRFVNSEIKNDKLLFDSLPDYSNLSNDEKLDNILTNNLFGDIIIKKKLKKMEQIMEASQEKRTKSYYLKLQVILLNKSLISINDINEAIDLIN